MQELLTGLVAPPAYFPLNVMMNIHGYESIDKVLERGQQALDPEVFEAAANETGAVILDTRAPQVFAKAFVPNAINIGIDGNFAPWVGTLLPDIQQPILLVTDKGREAEVITRLARVGYDQCIGYLNGGMESWQAAGKEVDSITSISPEELLTSVKEDEQILDVRKNSEFTSEHLIGAENVPLDFINENMQQLDPEKTYYVHCAGGYRSMIFISILKARGYDRLIDVKGGFKQIKETGLFKVTDYVCPSTLL